jgi:hypothetical protein
LSTLPPPGVSTFQLTAEDALAGLATALSWAVLSTESWTTSGWMLKEVGGRSVAGGAF